MRNSLGPNAMASDNAVERTQTALLAEDDPSLRQYASLLLQQHGFVVLSACNGSEALTIHEAFPGRIDLLVTDFNMGDGPNGIEVVRQLRQRQPGLAALVISGTPDSEQLAAESGLPFLAKPFSLGTFLSRVEEVMRNGLSPDRGRTAGGGG